MTDQVTVTIQEPKSTFTTYHQNSNEWTAKSIVAVTFFYLGFIFPPLWIIGFFAFRSQNDREYFWGTMNVSACAMCSFIIYVVAGFTWIFFMYYQEAGAAGITRTYYLNFTQAYLEPGEWVAIAYALLMCGILGYELMKYLIKLKFVRKMCKCCLKK
ncbi:predicted protein [Naegleria gruberi]|uniref:Predicted protein n=1 Tax=Naegleria gruberi TaxID=5762 RepID=D2VCU2_NAEGR|nr:uncharacterized protein NAEGRDRAFT_66692 [Naegleria gruberi]EFC45364.1 predicted protein [Naegleria gruberi]|eukprot:XP_002678108.1 predicted protein [Naegleria gruberi strain NEG-M]